MSAGVRTEDENIEARKITKPIASKNQSGAESSGCVIIIMISPSNCKTKMRYTVDGCLGGRSLLKQAGAFFSHNLKLLGRFFAPVKSIL